MSGHSKWHSIKHKKAANDAKRGKILTKHAKILMVVGRNDPNPETNAPLRNAISNAKSDGVPKDNIEKLLKKLAGEGKDGVVFSEQIYEGFGPAGIPFIVQALTDNVNRTYPSVRMAFGKNGGTIGTSGTVMFMFDHIGVIHVKTAGKTEDEMFELIMESGAEDLEFGTDETIVMTAFTNLSKVCHALEDVVEILKSEPQYRAKDPQKITDPDILAKVEKFIDAVEEAEDVDEVTGGFIVDDSLLTD